jgi:hypothetical protein
MWTSVGKSGVHIQQSNVVSCGSPPQPATAAAAVLGCCPGPPRGGRSQPGPQHMHASRIDLQTVLTDSNGKPWQH